ncbi:hypothetical protein Tco_0538378 [Tanacetum coccineum]
MVPDEEEKIERYIWGLPDNIQGNVTSFAPTSLQDAIRMANSLMDQKGGATKKIGYAGDLPYCNKCRFHHSGQCTIRCGNCKKVGYMARDCKAIATATTQRAHGANQRVLRPNQRVITCYKCRGQRHFRNDYPKLKNQNRWKQAANSKARGWAYALGGG